MGTQVAGAPTPGTSRASGGRSERLEARLTREEKHLIDAAIDITGQDRSSFVVSEAVLAAQRVIADQERYRLTHDQQQAWEALNARPARSLAGLRGLLTRPSPFIE